VNAPRITTARLELAPLLDSDREEFFAYRADPAVSRFQSFAPRTIDDVDAFLDRLHGVAFDTPGAWFQFAIRLRGTGELVGDLGTRARADDPSQVEFGISLAPERQGQGLAAEALAALFDHLFGACGKHRVFASVDPRNEPSVALLRRLGMRQEAHFRRSLRFRGEWVDDLVFALLASEWTPRS